MAVSLHISSLTEEQQYAIGKYLLIEPKENFFEQKRKKWKKYSGESDDKDSTVVFYRMRQDGTVCIPYKFSTLLLGKNVNLEKKFVKCLFDNNIVLREEQVDIYNEGFNKLISTLTVNFCPFTGSGKTKMAIKMSSELSKIDNIGLVLVMVTFTTLLDQWKKAIESSTNTKAYIVDGQNFKPPDDINFLICTPGMIDKIPSAWIQNIGLLIIDEAHTFCSSSRVDALLATSPKYVIACTATFEREDNMHVMMEVITGPERVIRISQKPFVVTKLLTGCDIPVPKNKYEENDFIQLVTQLSADHYRNNLILELIKINYVQHKIMVLTSRKEHVKFLYDETVKLNIVCDYLTDKKKKFSDSRVLYGTPGKMGTGFDVESLCEDYDGTPIDLLIIAISIKSALALEQRCGRAFRSTFPNIIYLVDDNHISQRHFDKNREWFISRNGTIQEYKTHRAIENEKRMLESGESRDNTGIAYKQMQMLVTHDEISNQK